MIHTTSESDVTSLGGSTSSSSAASPPKQHHPPAAAAATSSYYYVQSPSRDSHDDADNKSSINSQTTPAYTSPMESPSHPSQSRPSSSAASRISGPYRGISSLAGKQHHNHHHHRVFRKKNHHDRNNHKGWPPLFSVIDEEDGGYSDEDFHGDEVFMKRCRITLLLLGFLVIFSTACFVTWGASRPYRLQLQMKSWRVNNFYYGEGSDQTGVPTKLLTVNCTVEMKIQNPATFFGIHVSSTSLNLFYSQVVVGSGQFIKHYQPKKSQRTVLVNVEGHRVPLYGAGAGLVMSDNNGSIPLKLEFEIHSQANLVGKLVRTKHRRHVLCVLQIDPKNNKMIDFKRNSCSYN